MKYFFLCANLLISSWLIGQNRPVTLSESIGMALENSSQLRKSKLDREALEIRLREGRSAMYPKIQATLGVDYYGALPTQIAPGEAFGLAEGTYIPLTFGRPWQGLAGVTLQQQIFNEAQRRQIPAMNTSRALADLLIERSREDVIFQTATIFYQTLQTEQLLRGVNANLDKLDALERVAQLQLANGFAVPTDVKRIKVARTNLQTQRQNLFTAINTLRQTLQFLCGVAFEDPFEPFEPMGDPVADSLRWQQIILEVESTTENRLLLRQIELNGIQQRSLAAEGLPSLSGYASAATQSFRTDANFADTGSRWFGTAVVGFRLHVPIFDGFQRQRKKNLLAIDAQKIEEDRRQVTMAKGLEYRQAREQLNNAFRALRAQTDNVALAREISDKFMLQYREGVVSLTDLLNAQTALSEAETSYWQQVFNYKLAALKLLKSAGRLDEITK
ncbi:MAG: TolC family protein [Saprospiraceae bacterium]|nr:TolC family protein [Saprospiraceae bacterium]